MIICVFFSFARLRNEDINDMYKPHPPPLPLSLSPSLPLSLSPPLSHTHIDTFPLNTISQKSPKKPQSKNHLTIQIPSKKIEIE
jgi:hypothetical protein